MGNISLTTKETQIIRLIAEGKTTPSIASAMGLAPETVKWYRKRILDKFQAATSAEVIRKAIDLKLL
ncbi:MAG: helix-turn-helix transcriptional regulator [Bacteroidales bacterium]|nr:helix-turn-helix transcriptional regulator [Bacteroidales bacterium]